MSEIVEQARVAEVFVSLPTTEALGECALGVYAELETMTPQVAGLNPGDYHDGMRV